MSDQETMLMFSRNSNSGNVKSRDKSSLVESPARYSTTFNNNNTVTTELVVPGERRSSRASMKKSRPHSWHSTLQKGLARARSRSSGREKERDKLKRASSALNSGIVRDSPAEREREMASHLEKLMSF